MKTTLILSTTAGLYIASLVNSVRDAHFAASLYSILSYKDQVSVLSSPAASADWTAARPAVLDAIHSLTGWGSAPSGAVPTGWVFDGDEVALPLLPPTGHAVTGDELTATGGGQ